VALSSSVAPFSQATVEGDSDVTMSTPDIPKTPSKRPNDEVENEEGVLTLSGFEVLGGK